MNNSTVKKNFATDFLKSTLVSLIIGTILLLILAIIVHFVPVSETVVTIIDEVIKILAIFLGCFLGIKERKNGIIKGVLCGLLYGIGTFLISGIINKGFVFTWGVVLDIALCAVIGAICGILSVNIGKKR